MFTGRTALALTSVLLGAKCAAGSEDSLSLLQTQAQKHHPRVSLAQEQASEEELYENFVEPGEQTEHGPRADAPKGSLRSVYDAQHETAEEYHNLKFNKIEYRNLGGLGPHTDVPEGLKFKNVAKTYDGKPVDMVMTSSNYVSAKPKKTGLAGSLAVVNILNGHEVDFVCSFVDKDGKAVSLGKFHISFFDLDTGKEAGEEELTIGGFLKSYMIDNTELTSVEMADGRTKFIAGEPGIGADNPTDPLMLTDLQAARTVSFVFPAGLDSFKFTYKVHANANGSPTEGRHFQMAGMSSMYFCDTKPISMDFDLATVSYSNLGGQGPDFNSPQALHFSNIAAIMNDQIVDLKITNLTEYIPTNTSNNGLNGQFAQLNIAGGSNTRFRFQFLKQGTDEPVVMDWTYWSVYDLDHGKKKDKFQEIVEAKGFSTHYLTETSEIELHMKGEKWYEYASTTYGTAGDNPSDPMGLTQLQKDRAVTFLYHDISQFDVRFAAKPPKNAGRNFLFAGKSSVVFC